MSAAVKHGGRREGSGRPKGSLSKRSIAAIEAVAERWPDWSPLNHFAEVANNAELAVEIRLDAAKAAAPYVHPRPKGIELDADAVVELEGRIAAARLMATAQAMEDNPGLADRLERAARSIVVVTGIERAPDSPMVEAIAERLDRASPAMAPEAVQPEPMREAAPPGPKPRADRKPDPEPYRPVTPYPEPQRFKGTMSDDYRPFED
jgi:hypothetical protein